MPEIAATVMPAAPISAIGVAPTTPGASAALGAANASTAGTAGAATTPMSFLDQLKSALAGLSRARMPLPLGSVAPLGEATTTTATTSETPTVAPDEPETAADASAPDVTQAMPELLAALGFVLVPQTLTPLVPQHSAQTATMSGGTQTGVAHTLPDVLQAALPSSTLPTASAPLAAPSTATAPAAPADPSAPPSQLSSQVPVDTSLPAAPAPELALPNVPNRPNVPLAHVPLPAAPAVPNGHASASDGTTAVSASDLAAAQVSVAPPQQHVAATPSQHPTPAPVDASQSAPTPAAPTFAGTQHNTSDNSAGDGRGSTATTDQPTPDVAAQPFAVAATPQPNSAAASSNVHPSEVVAQIAHQADLYRLPGNKGVRIQLHPEDLGGVEVTVRYGAGGALELHVNTEHASTGDLVQAGWSQLRDALATHGFSPDRLVMSVSAPSSTGASTFSGDNSGRSGTNSNTAAFNFAQGQQQSGQQREPGDSRSGFGWRQPFESSTTPVEPVARSAADSSSRIDYRA